VRVAVLVHPFFVESGEQLAFAEPERLLEPFVLDVITKHARVDPHFWAAEADSLARCEQRAICVTSQAPPKRPDRVSQAGAGARVQHFWPEASGDVGSPVVARVEREPGQ
jgi:hypothetical protein